MNPQDHTWYAPHPITDELEIIHIYENSPFPWAREDGVWCRGKTRPISQRKFNDHRLLIAYSTLRPDASSVDGGLYIRRVFYMLPRDIEHVRANRPIFGREMVEIETALDAIFDAHISTYPKRLQEALKRQTRRNINGF
jgi:hypothetical protein